MLQTGISRIKTAYRLSSLLETAMATSGWEWNAPRKWLPRFAEPSSWPSCPLCRCDVVTGVTRSASRTPCRARWPASVVPCRCDWFRRRGVPASCPLRFPRSCCRWPVSRIATRRPGAPPARLATSPRRPTLRSPRRTRTWHPTCGRSRPWARRRIRNTLTICPRPTREAWEPPKWFK